MLIAMLTGFENPVDGQGQFPSSETLMQRHTVRVSYDEKAYRTGVSKDGIHIRYFALANPENDICEGKIVETDMVLFFPEYRDHGDFLDTIPKRRDAWSGKIKQLAKTTIRGVKTHADNTPSSSLPWENKISILARLYQCSKESVWIDRLSRLVEEALDPIMKGLAPSLINIGRMEQVKAAEGNEKDLKILRIRRAATNAILCIANSITIYID